MRYFLLREVGFEADGNFTWDRFDERYTADLADGFGNLASRSLAMLANTGMASCRSPDRHLARPGRPAGADAYARAMDALDLRGGAEAAWGLVATANLYIQQVAPWTLAKDGKERRAGRRACRARRALYRLAVLGRARSSRAKAQLLWQSLGSRGDASTRRLGVD